MIKENPEISGVRLMLLTSLGRRGDSARMAWPGFAGCLTKPLRRSSLKEMLLLIMNRENNNNGDTKQPVIPQPVPTESVPRNVRILLVEDNIINQKVAEGMLKKFGYQADVAANGLEAVEALSRIRYDLVLMDCQMPEMDGFEASRRIRGTDSSALDPGTPIIAMTANAMQGDRDRCLSAGMNDYLPKPVKLLELKEMLHRWLPAVDEAPRMQRVVPEKSQVAVPAGDDVFFESELLERLMDDRELARTIVAGFLYDAPLHVSKLKGHLSEGNSSGVQLQAHTLKGAAANLGAPALQRAAQELEKLGKTGSLGEAPDLLPRLETELERLKDTLEQRGWI